MVYTGLGMGENDLGGVEGIENGSELSRGVYWVENESE